MSVVRRIDDLGRIAIPKEFRNILHLHDGDCIEIDFCNNWIGEKVIRVDGLSGHSEWNVCIHVEDGIEPR